MTGAIEAIKYANDVFVVSNQAGVDIRKFYDSIDHEWLMRMVEHRIADPRILRLLRQWLEVGVLENGVYAETVEGTPQGAGISPLLANIFLHYALDLWVQQWMRRAAAGQMRLAQRPSSATSIHDAMISERVSWVFEAAVHSRSSYQRIPDGFSRLFRNAHHPGHCAGAACGGLNPDPATRVRGADPHLLCSKAASSRFPTSDPPLRAVVAHSRRRSALRTCRKRWNGAETQGETHADSCGRHPRKRDDAEIARTLRRELIPNGESMLAGNEGRRSER